MPHLFIHYAIHSIIIFHDCESVINKFKSINCLLEFYTFEFSMKSFNGVHSILALLRSSSFVILSNIAS